MDDERKEKIINFLKGVLIGSVVLGFSQFCFDKTNVIRNNSIYTNARLYDSEKELRRDFKLEKKKLGLENLDVDLEIVDSKGLIGRATHYHDGSYKI